MTAIRSLDLYHTQDLPWNFFLICGVCGQPGEVKVGEAYLMAISNNMPESKRAVYKKPQGRDQNDQYAFKNRLIKAYCTDSAERASPMHVGCH